MTANKQTWTVLQILNTTADFFKSKNIENPRLNAEQLLSYQLEMNRLQLYLRYDQVLTSGELIDYRKLVRRRAGNEPLQYIIGKTDFMGLSFNVNKSVLIPRPETELLVEKTLALQSKFKGKTSIWDIGTGSGCVGISLAHYWPGSIIYATEISAGSLDMAKSNAKLNHTDNKIHFIQHDIITNLAPFRIQMDIIVCNPPYISKDELRGLDSEIREYEPWVALTDGGNGLGFYKRIFTLISDNLACKYLMIELSGSQHKNILNLVAAYKFESVEIHKDYNNIPRVLEVQIE